MLADQNASIKYHNAMSKTVKCIQHESNLITINGKQVTKDMADNWIGASLDMEEAKFFNVFLYTIQKLRTGRNITATYTV